MMEKGKKSIILFSLIVIVLVISVIGISFALFGFMGTGITENKITTGSVNISYSDSYDSNTNPNGLGIINIENGFPMSDVDAISSEANVLSFTVNADMSGEMNIVYDIGVTDVIEGETLTSKYIKFVLLDDNGYVLGNQNEGIKLFDRKNLMGLNQLIDHYYLSSGSFSTSGVKHYKLIVWISDEFQFSTTTTDLGTSHSSVTNGENFSFKIIVKAAQA